MTCDEMKKLMFSKVPELYTRTERVTIHSHLDSCPSCRNWLQERSAARPPGAIEPQRMEELRALAEKHSFEDLTARLTDPELPGPSRAKVLHKEDLDKEVAVGCGNPDCDCVKEPQVCLRCRVCNGSYHSVCYEKATGQVIACCMRCGVVIARIAVAEGG